MQDFTITDNAAKQIITLLSLEEDKTHMRVVIQAGGCSGFQYKFELDNKVNSQDIEFTYKDANIVIDDISMHMIKNGQLDFVEDLSGSEFVITNPNATASCGCGTSFSV